MSHYGTTAALALALAASAPRTSSAAAALCSTPLRLTRFEPPACYHHFDASRCADSCSDALSALQPQCFTEVELPCELSASLLSALPEAGLGDVAVPVAALLAHPDPITRLHVFQQSLYTELYGSFLPPAAAPAGAAQRVLQREDYRLDLLEGLQRISAPLVQAAGFRRFTQGAALAPGVESDFQSLLGLARRSPLHAPEQRSLLVAELEAGYARELAPWRLLQSFPLSTVAAARASYLNARADALVSAVSVLPPSQQQRAIARAAALDAWLPLHLQSCGAARPCREPLSAQVLIAAAGADYPFELLLEELIAEARALAEPRRLDQADAQFQPAPLRELDLIERHYAAYSVTPSLDALSRLEVALAVASGALIADGRELLEVLAGGASASVEGFATLSRLGSLAVLPCEELRRAAPRLQQIQLELVRIAAQFELLLAEDARLPQPGPRVPLTRQLLRELALRADRLRREAAELTRFDRFTPDRRTTLTWVLERELLERSEVLELEYLSVRGLYWTPAMAIPLQQLIPSVAELFTPQGTLLPSGQGRLAGAQTLQLRLDESPYFACQPEAGVQLVLRQHAPGASGRRLILTADLSTVE